NGDHTVKSKQEAPTAGMHSIEVRVDNDTVERVTLDIRYKTNPRLPADRGSKKRYPALDLTVIHASEVGVPLGRKPILWKLVTDLEVADLDAAIEKIRWYSTRWKIEVFHKILKSGCRAEDAKLRTADRLANLVALFCIVSWRVMWMTMMARAAPDADPAIAFTATEIAILDRLVTDSGNRRAKPGTLQLYLTKLSRLGGYLARMSDPPPGNTVVWRGLRRLVDIQIGAELATCG
ncbi:IS4 family transposase, partial [Sphingobium sp. Ant17]|uniref:IS4 family transposase n=1 Tax=Sphingobium sp. Ant17 TaxID=1461752 RepID=UPI001269038D